MLTGRRFLLRTATLALDSIDGKRVAIKVPEGAILRVAGPAQEDRMVDVFWNGRAVSMFSVDVAERGEEIAEMSAGA